MRLNELNRNGNFEKQRKTKKIGREFWLILTIVRVKQGTEH